MSIYALLRNAYYEHGYSLTAEQVELDGALDGNLCRCTGYKPILDAAKSFVADTVNGRANGTNGLEQVDGANGDGLGGKEFEVPCNYKLANMPIDSGETDRLSSKA
jgi:xanthine dehydrogenase/oxidase